MTKTDALIIFLSFGSPFAVHHFVQSRNREPLLMRLAGSLYNLIFWLPITLYRGACLFTSLLQRMFFNDRRTIAVTDELENLERIIGSCVVTGNDISLHFRFKDVFLRYSGLSQFVYEIKSDSEIPANEIFKISGHNAPELAARCLSRRNLQRALRHQQLARNEFTEIVAKTLSETDQNLSNAVVRLSEIVSDPELVRALALDSTTVPSSDKTRISKVQAVTESETVISVAG